MKQSIGIPVPFYDKRDSRRNHASYLYVLVSSVVMSFVTLCIHQNGLATPTAEIKPEQDRVTLEFEHTDIARHFPIYDQGEIRYFSAGVGKEERQPEYPAFPLKLVFASGTGSFLAYISVDIHNQDGSLVANIPAKHVTGPWLFVDLDPGVYEIVATNKDGETVRKQVPIQQNNPLSLPLYWKS